VIAGKTWREMRWMALAYLLILELLCVPVLLWWPDIYPELQRSPMLRNLGIGEFAIRIGRGIGNDDQDVAYRSWVALMLFLRSANLGGIAAAVLLGTGLFARERENQTFEWLLSRPVGRGRILWQKVWPAATCIVVPLFLVNASAFYWSSVIGERLPPYEMFLATTHAAVFALAFLLFTTWMSVLLRVQAHVAAVVGAVAIVQLGLYLTQRIRPYTLFRLVDFDWYGPMLAGNIKAWQMFDPLHGPGFTTWLLLACALFYGLAWRALQRAEP
jgi:ABC-type transport system involved in multi-copper enzyme maturation permease subunit